MSPQSRRKRYQRSLAERQETETARDAKVGTITALGNPAQVSIAGKPPISVSDLGGNHQPGEAQIIHKPLGASIGQMKSI